MNELISDLLDLARASAPLERGPLDLSSSAREVVRRLLPQYARRERARAPAPEQSAALRA